MPSEPASHEHEENDQTPSAAEVAEAAQEDPQFANISGLKTEIPKDCAINARTITILYTMEANHGVVYFQTDDSPQDAETIKHLSMIAGEVGYDLVKLADHTYYLVDRSSVPEVQ